MSLVWLIEELSEMFSNLSLVTLFASSKHHELSWVVHTIQDLVLSLLSGLFDREISPAFWGNCIIWNTLLSPAQANDRTGFNPPEDVPFLFCFASGLVVSQPSICHPLPVSAPSKGSDFKMERFLFIFSGRPVMLAEFLSWEKKRTSLHQRRVNERSCTNPLIHRTVEVNLPLLVFILPRIQSPISGSVMTRL